MLRVLRNQIYRRLFTAQIVALLGTGLATVALGLLAYDVAGGHASLVLGGIFTVKMIAYVFVAPLTSAALVRLPRRTVARPPASAQISSRCRPIEQRCPQKNMARKEAI